MALELKDHAIIGGMILASRLGGFIVTSRYLRRLAAWMVAEVKQLHEGLAWCMDSIWEIGLALRAHLKPRPKVKPLTPPPVPASYRDALAEMTDPSGET